MKSVAFLIAALLLAACSEQQAPKPPAAPRSDVMQGQDDTPGALAGAAGTTGGPSSFGGPSTDSEQMARFDAPSGMIDPLRGTASLLEEPEPPALVNAENKDIRRTRSYAMQPPTIPHKTDNYQVDKYANKCLTCHSRARTEESQAPPISITHYTDRNGNFLAQISPRRYFCEQCHVVQMETKPLVTNNFEDVDKLLKPEPAKRPR